VLSGSAIAAPRLLLPRTSSTDATRRPPDSSPLRDVERGGRVDQRFAAILELGIERAEHRDLERVADREPLAPE